MSHNTNVVTRFAPSPTGFLHIGGIRTALFAYLWARKHKGTFILRIEDTDKEREVPGSVQHIQDSLRWLGLEWDFGPNKPGSFGSCIQSERLPIYKKYAEELVKKGLAYPDPYSEAELENFRLQAETEKRPFLYRNHRPETFEAWDGTKPLRLKTPEIKRYAWNDLVRGELEAGEEALDDFILIKSDGYPTYNFAHIVDDHEMSVTHVMRGEEFISSTPKFLSLYDALGFIPPQFATMPVILGPDGKKKLSKRDGAKDILDYEKEGYLPEVMVNFLALIGWNPGTDQEIFSLSELIDAFELTKVQKSGGAFNPEKLNWMNREYIKRLPVSTITAEIKKHLTPEQLQQPTTESLITTLTPLVLERISTLGEIGLHLAPGGEFDFCFSRPSPRPDLLKTPEFLPATLERLEQIHEEHFSAEGIKSALWDFATEQGRANVLWPLRVSLTGKERSPDPFSVAALLGKQETIERVRNAIQKTS